jgi:hypothetical protein
MWHLHLLRNIAQAPEYRGNIGEAALRVSIKSLV